jgi:ADP-Ribosyltransferase in polyvalent proteins
MIINISISNYQGSGDYHAIPVKRSSTSARKPTTNSLGNPIHKTTEGIANFWAWFGDSKIVDEQGRPLVAYHGTNVKFTKVNMRKGSQNLFWFVSNKKAITDGTVGANGSGIVMELYIKLENPAQWEQYEQLGTGQYASRNLDGAILKDLDDTFVGFVLNADQVKSVKNKGAFDPSKSILGSSIC